MTRKTSHSQTVQATEGVTWATAAGPEGRDSAHQCCGPRPHPGSLLLPGRGHSGDCATLAVPANVQQSVTRFMTDDVRVHSPCPGTRVRCFLETGVGPSHRHGDRGSPAPRSGSDGGSRGSLSSATPRHSGRSEGRGVLATHTPGGALPHPTTRCPDNVAALCSPHTWSLMPGTCTPVFLAWRAPTVVGT